MWKYINLKDYMKEKRKKVAVYWRVSSDSNEQLNSFENQVRYYEKLYTNHTEFELYKIYADEGTSGRPTAKIIEFKNLIADGKKKRFDVVITKSISKFARNTLDCLNTVNEFKELGIEIIFEKENIRTFAPKCYLMESENISKNIKWTYKKRAEQGNIKAGTSPYGYDVKDGVLVPDKEVVIGRKIFEIMCSGYGTNKITEILNFLAIPTRRNTKWSDTTVREILKILIHNYEKFEFRIFKEVIKLINFISDTEVEITFTNNINPKDICYRLYIQEEKEKWRREDSILYRRKPRSFNP